MGRVGKSNLRVSLLEINKKSDAGLISALSLISSPCILIFKAAVPYNLSLSFNWVWVENDCIALHVKGLSEFCGLVFGLGLYDRVLCLPPQYLHVNVM